MNVSFCRRVQTSLSSRRHELCVNVCQGTLAQATPDRSPLQRPMTMRKWFAHLATVADVRYAFHLLTWIFFVCLSGTMRLSCVTRCLRKSGCANTYARNSRILQNTEQTDRVAEFLRSCVGAGHSIQHHMKLYNSLKDRNRGKL